MIRLSTFQFWMKPIHSRNLLEIKNLLKCKFKQVKDIGSIGNTKCTVCLSEIEDEDEVYRLPCSHLFHTDCIKPWITEVSNKCPICRVEIAKGKPLI